MAEKVNKMQSSEKHWNRNTTSSEIYRLSAVILGVFCLIRAAGAEVSADWSHFGATQAGTNYSPLDQIQRGNVKDLEVAWTYSTGEMDLLTEEQARQQAFENTPIILDGSLIICTPIGRILAVDPATGTERWVFDPNEYPLPENLNYPRCRGVSHWLDPEAAAGSHCQRRIIYGNREFKAFAIDSRTGLRCEDFGDNGVVSFAPGKPLAPGEFMMFTSPPAVLNNVVIFGSMIADSVRQDAPSGKVRALDARTGELRWTFDPVPRDADDPAMVTWHGNSALGSGNANVWSVMSVDEERDLVFLPTTSPSTDFYGGERPGENRYANSVVALRGQTGEMAWHYQITHHDVWDYDLPAQPILVDLPRDGQTVPAVIQITKQGLIFVLHRETGEPLFPVEEQPVPQGGVPGEWLSPTQPVPQIPPPLLAQGLSPDDAWGFTFVDRFFCRKQIEALRHDGMYAPISLQGTVLMPGFTGGPNWGGGAYDHGNGLLIVNTINIAAAARMIPRSTDAADELAAPEMDISEPIRFHQLGTPYSVDTWFLVSPLGAPCTKPPWGRLTAVDMVEGTIKWQVALGSLEKLMPVPLPLELGTPNAGGTMITGGGLAFIAASADDKFRAFDVETGEVLWTTLLPAGGQAIPMTYAVAGRQYVVIAAGGHALFQTTPGDYVIAFALNDDRIP